MSKLMSAFAILWIPAFAGMTISLCAQDYSGTYEMKNYNGSSGTLTVKRISGQNYSFSMYAWWNIASARHGSLDGQVSLDNHGIGVYYGDYGCSMTVEFLGLGANVTFGGCESFNLPQDFTGYYLKTSSGQYRNFEVIANRSYFYHSVDAGAPTKVYVIAGDVVMVTEILGNYAYAILTNSSGRTTEGWLLVETLREIR